MILLRTSWSGLGEAIERLNASIEALHQGIDDDLMWFGEGAVNEMVATHTFTNRTYRLEDSIRYILRPYANYRASIDVEAGAPYASQVEFGHPGPPPARPYPFYYPIWFKWLPLLDERLAETVRLALAEGRVR